MSTKKSKKVKPSRPKVDRWGFIDATGKLVIPCKFELVEPFFNGLAIATANGLEGSIDQSGQWVIQPVWEGMGRHMKKLCSVKKEQKWGYIDISGSFIIPPQFDFAYGFSSSGLARVEIEEKIGYINQRGKVIIKPRFTEANDFHDGLALVTEADQTGQKRSWFINEQGKKLYGPFLEAEEYSDGLAWVRTEQSDYVFIDTHGKVALRLPPRVIADRFFDGVAAADDQTQHDENYMTLMGYIDKRGQWVIKPQFDYTYGFINGVATVRVNKRYGAIDRQGKYIVRPQWQYLDHLVEGRMTFTAADDRCGFLDAEGRIVIEPIYEAAQDFSEGLAGVCIEQEAD